MAETVDGFGLNKAARLKALRRSQAEEERKKALPLDPPYPGGMAPFDPFYFGVEFVSSEVEEG